MSSQAFAVAPRVLTCRRRAHALLCQRWSTSSPPSSTSSSSLTPSSPLCTSMALSVGSRVRVVDDGPVMYHLDRSAKDGVSTGGLTGVIIQDISSEDGVEMTATAPYIVKLDDYPKPKAHFSDFEIEEIE